MSYAEYVESCVQVSAKELADLRRAARQTATLTGALAAIVADLEMRADLKRGADKGLVDVGASVYERAKAALDAMEKED